MSGSTYRIKIGDDPIMTEGLCKQCGAVFEFDMRASKGHIKKYCGPQCSQDAVNKRARATIHAYAEPARAVVPGTADDWGSDDWDRHIDRTHSGCGGRLRG